MPVREVVVTVMIAIRDPWEKPQHAKSGRLICNAVRIVLGLAVVLSLLAGAVCFVFAVLVMVEGKLSQFWLAFAAGVFSWFVAWLCGKCVSGIKRRLTDQAIAEHAHAIQFDPSDSIAHNNHGTACHQKGEYAKAIAHFEAAIRLDPQGPNAYVGRVNAFGALGQWDRVIAEYSDAIRLDPNHALAYCARATAYNGIGRWERSIPDATTAIRLAADLYLGYDARGYGYLQRGGFHWIIKLIAIAWLVGTFAFLRRDHFDWRTPTGSKADFDKAIADFTEALRLNPRAWDCYAGRARAYRSIGDHEQARADENHVRQALRLN